MIIRSDEHLGGVGGERHAPNTFEIVKNLAKSRPCYKRVGHSAFHDLFFLATIVGQMVKAPSHPNGKYLETSSLIRTSCVTVARGRLHCRQGAFSDPLSFSIQTITR